MKKTVLLLLICLILFFCTGKKNPKVMMTKRITVSILPQKYFVNRIAKGKWDVNVMVPPGHNPATYEPTPLQMKTLDQSTLYFRIGHIVFEKAWMDNLISINPQIKVVDASKGIRLIKSIPHHHYDHSTSDHVEQDKTKDEEKPGEEGVDPHIWLSPIAVEKICRNILDALIEADPENHSFYKRNCREFINEIDQLNLELIRILNNLRGKKFMVYHPAWSYFARDYGLIQLPIESEGKHPRPADLRRIIDTAKREGIKVIFVQQQFDTHSAEAIAKEIEGKVIQMDPLALDWIKNMKKIANTFKDTLQ